MKTFYVLFNGVTYLGSLDTIELGDDSCYYWHPDIGAAHRFEYLHRAHQFLGSSGFEIEILKVEITSVYTPNLFTKDLPECTDSQNTISKD